MRKERYTAPITAEEKARFVPFIHMLIDTAFDVIVPRFLTGFVSKDKSDGSPVTEADKLAEETPLGRFQPRVRVFRGRYPQHSPNSV